MDIDVDVICGAESSTNECHLAVFSVDVAFFPVLCGYPPPPFSFPIAVIVVLAMPVNKVPKMSGNSASYPFYSQCIRCR